MINTFLYIRYKLRLSIFQQHNILGERVNQLSHSWGVVYFAMVTFQVKVKIPRSFQKRWKKNI